MRRAPRGVDDDMNALKESVLWMLERVLPVRVKNSLLHASYHLARKEFEKYAFLHGYAPHMELGLEAIARRGFTPETVIDVGAFQGEWSMTARSIWPSARLTMVEPNFEKREMLTGLCSRIQATLINELLGPEDGKEIQYYVMGPGSTVLNEYSPVPRRAEVRKLRTLDSLIPEIKAPGFLKIDAQGFELEILKGASRLLADIEAVLLEISLIEINQGAPLLHDVLAFMKSRGFLSYEILEIHRRPLDKAMNQVDIFFVREGSKLIADRRHYAS